MSTSNSKKKVYDWYVKIQTNDDQLDKLLFYTFTMYWNSKQYVVSQTKYIHTTIELNLDLNITKCNIGKYQSPNTWYIVERNIT